jgi:hypothetical protein
MYTQLGPKADKEIEKYLKKIVKVIRAELPQIKGVLLGGGFGRGEGGAYFKDNLLIPLNDFEIFLYTSSKIPSDILNQTANKAVKTLPLKNIGTDFYHFDRERFSNTFYIDIKCLTDRTLPALPPMIRYFELKNASRLLWGKDPRGKIPNYKVKDIPKTEGLRLLLNRLTLINLYFSLDFLKRPITQNEKIGLLYLGSKTLYDIPTALLLLNNQFVPYYQKRSEIFAKCYQKDFPILAKTCPELPQIVKKATDFKLKPSFKTRVKPFKIWSQYKYYSGEALKYYATKFFGKKISSPSEISDLILQKMSPLHYHPFLNFYAQKKFRLPFFPKILVPVFEHYFNFQVYLNLKKYAHIKYPKILLSNRGFDLVLYATSLYLLYSVDKSGKINQKMFKKAIKIFQKVYPFEPKKKSGAGLWNQVNDAFSNAYVNFSFLKII